jgi:hypothetical protein
MCWGILLQDGAAGAVDGAGVVAGQRANVDGIFVRVGHVGQAFPAFANADYLAAHFLGAIDDRLDYRIQTGHVAAACEDTDIIFRSHE